MSPKLNFDPNPNPIIFELCFVTVETAKLWLGGGFKNRRVQITRVLTYAESMKRGQFPLTHQPVAFNEKNQLVDGQHRLHAIIKSGIPCWLYVARYTQFTAAHFDGLDCGATRTAACKASIEEIEHPNTKVAVAKMIASYFHPSKIIQYWQQKEILELFEVAFQELPMSVEFKYAPFYSACIFSFGAAPDTVRRFYKTVITCQGAADRCPALAISLYLRGKKKKGGDGKSRTEDAMKTFQCLYHFMHGTPVEKVAFGKQGLEYFKAKQQETSRAIESILGA